MVMESSKTSSLKALLLKAWRERWSDLQWGIHIKTVLPRGVSGDVYNLADCILQQALIGPGPNPLVLSYLQHSLCSQLVSYGAVLQGISKYQCFQKPHCVMTLLDLLDNLSKSLTCRGKPEECLMLSTALLSSVSWLLSCANHALGKLSESRMGSTAEYLPMLEKPLAILREMYRCSFVEAMLHLAKHEDRDVQRQIINTCQEIELALVQGAVAASKEHVEEVLSLVRKPDPFETLYELSTPNEPLAYCLNAVIMFEALLHPTRPVEVFVDQLLMIQTLKGYSAAELYCEIVRTCFIGLVDSVGSSEEMRWDGFTFLKIPHVLACLHWRQTGKTDESVPSVVDNSPDVVAAFEMILQYPSILNMADVKSSCNCMEFLLKELVKVGLVTENQAKTLLVSREEQIPHKPESGPSAGNACLILRAEPTVSSILKTLDADYTKNQEALLGVLCQMLSGKSFELILTAAAAIGKLQTFAQKLIKFNECSKQIPGENTKASQQRATLFDISFLMLCHIVQTYGSQVALSEESGESFFEQWVRECMVEKGCVKSPELMIQKCDQAKIDMLMQVSMKDGELKTSLVKWHEVCMHIPGVMKEVLIAWEHSALSTNDVKRILDNIRSKMCCLSVCATAWLCSHIQILHQDAFLKPMNVVQHFLAAPPNLDDTSQQQQGGQDHFKERCTLMLQIVRKMCYDVLPPNHTKKSHSIASSKPINELLDEIWGSVRRRGWLDLKSIRSLESLFNIGGAQWFVTTLLKEALNFPYQEDLLKYAELVFSIFHLDIEKCTVALLLHTLPQFLYNQSHSEELCEPQGRILARLAVCCIYAALQQAGQGSKSVRLAQNKRARKEMDVEDMYGLLDGAGPIKMRRLSIHTPESEDLTLCMVPPSSSQPIPEADDTLTRAVVGLFRAFQGIIESPTVSQHTQFVFRFLEECVKCGRDKVRTTLQFMPLTLVPSLLKLLPELFTTEMVLKLYDLNTTVGRRSAARSLCMLHYLQKPLKC